MANDSQSFFRPSSASWNALGSSPKVCAPSSTVIVRHTIAMLIRVAAEIRFMAIAPFPFSAHHAFRKSDPTRLRLQKSTQSLLILLLFDFLGACATLALALFVFIFARFENRQRVEPAPNRQRRQHAGQQ